MNAPAGPAAPAPPTAAAPARRGVAWQALGVLGFLSVIPLPRRAHGMPSAVTLACFAPAGLLLGGIVAGLDVVLAPVLSVGARSAVLLAALAGLCGAMHLDGLMDSADGLYGATDRARRLEIMRDSRVGGYGVAAAVVVLLVQYGALTSLDTRRPLALLGALGLSRAASALALGVARPARPDGLGSVFSVDGRRIAGVIALGTAAAVTVVLCGWRGVAASGVALAATLAVVTVFHRHVGGMTGDGFGAVVELSLAGALLCLAAHP